MSQKSRRSARSQFFDYVPLRAQLTLYLAIFFIFSVMGFLFDLAGSGTKRPFSHVVLWAGLNGSIATLWAAAFIRRWNKPLFAAVMIPATFLVFWWAKPPMRFESRALLSGAMALGVVVAGYIWFVLFIRGQAFTTMRLLTEMSLARQIHANLTKPINLRTPRCEVYGRSDASSEMGGDVLDVVQRDGGLAAFLGDVSGHGVRAGVVMGMVKSAVRMKLRSSSALDDLLHDLNGVVCELAQPGMFVTFAAMRFKEAGRAQAVLAGHLPILHYRAGEGTWTEIEADHPPLGVLDGESFQAVACTCAPGDLLVLITDGLMEVFDEQGKQVGWHGIRQVITNLDHTAPLPEIGERIFQAARDFGPQVDDQSILLVRLL